MNVTAIASNGSTSQYARFEYIYQYKDHLGNIRLSYLKNADTDSLQVVEENNYYAFGMLHKGYNNAVTGFGNASAQKYKYNGKELQDELGLGWYDYGARNYDPALGRWMNIDPLAEASRRWSPYSYCYNNPLVFVDPDGMLAEDPTELFNSDGKKIGQDANGNDGNVSIINDKTKAKEIEKNYKKDGVATEADVNSGVQTTKAVLREALSVLNKAKAITNGDEAKSVVEPNGNVTVGTAATKLNDGEKGVTRTEFPTVPGDDNTGIHSHDVVIRDGVNDKGETIKVWNDALIPGPDDPAAFTKFKMNVIVGNLGAPELEFAPPPNANKIQVKTNPPQGAAFYPRGTTSPTLTLTEKAMTKIIK